MGLRPGPRCCDAWLKGFGKVESGSKFLKHPIILTIFWGLRFTVFFQNMVKAKIGSGT